MKRFRNILKTLKGSRFFRKILFSFIATFSVIFFVFFLLIVGGLSQRFKDDKISTNDRMIFHSEKIADSLLRDIYTYTSSLFYEDQYIMQLLYRQSWDDATQIRAINTIRRIQSSSNYIHSVYLINFNRQKVMTDYQFYDIDAFHDQELLEFLEEATPSASPIFFVPRTVNRLASYENSDSSGEDVWSLIYYSSHAGAMVINIDCDAFSQLLEMPPEGSARFYLLNFENRILASNDTSVYGNSFENSQILEELHNASEKSGHFTARDNGRQYTVSYSTDSAMGLITMRLEPYTLFDTTNGLLGISLAISLLYLFLCLLLSLIVSNMLYRPIDNFKTSVLQELPELPDKKSDDEFSVLYRAYHNIAVKNHHLKKYMDAYLSQSQERRLIRFLQGSAAAITPEEYTELSMLFPESSFQVVLMELDSQKADSDGLTGQPEDAALVMFSISNVADELFSSACAFRKLETGYSRLLYILNFQDEASFSLKELLAQLHKVINRHFSVSFSIGASSVVREIDDLPAASLDAENALNKRFVVGFNSTHISGSRDVPTTESKIYPFELESELINALKSLSSQKVEAALTNFFDKISSYPYSQMRLYILWLNYNIQRFEYLNHTQSEPVNIDAAYTLEDIRTMLTRRCLSIIQFMEDKKSAGSDRTELLDTLNRLISENLCNPNLSVVFLAAEVHLSVNYLRSIYKDQTGESLSGFITQKKLDLIYDLLLHTDMTIQDISDQLGFTTKNYFFTFFKKHTGMTPSQYRKLHAGD